MKGKPLLSGRSTILAAFGVLIVAAALAKATAPIPLWLSCWFSSSAELWGAILLAEFAVGLSLICHSHQVSVWGVATAFALAMTGIAATLSWQGFTSCECYGPIDVKPVVTAGFDGGMLALLLWQRPRVWDDLRRGLIWGIGFLSCSLVALGVLLVAARVVEHSSDKVVLNSVIRMGRVPAGQRIPFTIKIENKTDKPFRVLGKRVPYAFFPNLPLLVPPHSTRELHGFFVSARVRARYCVPGSLLVAHGNRLSNRTLRITGKIVGMSEGDSSVNRRPIVTKGE